MIPFSPKQLTLGAWCSAQNRSDIEFAAGTNTRIDTIRDLVSGEMPISSRGNYALIGPDNHAPTYPGNFLNNLPTIEIAEGQWLAGQRKAWTFYPGSNQFRADAWNPPSPWADDPLWIPPTLGGATVENRHEWYNESFLERGYQFGANTGIAHIGRDYHSFCVIKIDPPTKPTTDRANGKPSDDGVSQAFYDYAAGVPIWTGDYYGEQYHWLGLIDWTPLDPTQPGTMRFVCAPYSGLYEDGNESFVDFEFDHFGEWIIIDVRRVGYESVLRINGKVRATSIDSAELYPLDELFAYQDNVAFFGTIEADFLGPARLAASNYRSGEIDYWDGVGIIEAENETDRAGDAVCLPFFSIASGGWAEWVHVKVETTNDEAEKVRAYLAQKWGLSGSLPATHKYRYGIIPGLSTTIDRSFPALAPSTRTFTPSSRSSTSYVSIGGRDRGLLHSNERDYATLQLSFLGLQQVDVEKVRTHYQQQNGNFGLFALSAETVSQTAIFAEEIDRPRTLGEYAPTGRSWRYEGAPVAIQQESGLWDLTVLLRLANVDYRVSWELPPATVLVDSPNKIAYSRIFEILGGQVEIDSDVTRLTRNWFIDGGAPLVQVESENLLRYDQILTAQTGTVLVDNGADVFYGNVPIDGAPGVVSISNTADLSFDRILDAVSGSVEILDGSATLEHDKVLQSTVGVVDVQENNADLLNDVIIQAEPAVVESGLNTATLSYP